MLVVDGEFNVNATNSVVRCDGEMQSGKVETTTVGGRAGGGFEEDGERKMMMDLGGLIDAENCLDQA
ncbi:hypothetical protein Pint_24839 [Pistacia integerrima]|uniref:Uncharacterized protein n=1 Tax=Pistacia integerrima TaxID=434235 RepID=A0ACC0YFB9_9ROSI|nr:hypothetical protein Pint_24839 [Pistacia integerrima]